MEDVAQSRPKSGQGESSKQMWRMETVVNEVDPKEHLKNKKVDDTVSPMVTTDKPVEEISPMPPTSPEVFIIDDYIVNTQESVGMDICDTTVNDGGGVMIGDGKDKFQLAELAEVAKRKEVQDQGMRRRSERLKKDSNLTTKEKMRRRLKSRIWKVTLQEPILFLFCQSRTL